MKKILILLIIASMLFSILTSCANDTAGGNTDNGGTPDDNVGNTDSDNGGSTGDGGSTGNGGSTDDGDNVTPPPADAIDLGSDGFTFFCKGTDADVALSFENLTYRIKEALGTSPAIAASEAEASLIFGLDGDPLGSEADVVGRYSIYAEGGKIYVTASDAEALDAAKDALFAYGTTGGIYLPRDLNETALFNKLDYRLGKLTLYTLTEATHLPLLSGIAVDGLDIPAFNPNVGTYAIKLRGSEYPTVSASALSADAEVSIVQASEQTLGIATVTVECNGIGTNYTVAFYNEISTTATEIVNKNGAEGTICFVIDDGTESTAKFMLDNILGKAGYENIVATFALITRKVANLETDYDSEGNLVWKTDENGNYVYTEIGNNFDIWEQIVATGKGFLISHTHTHTYPGDNDSGGTFRYKKNDGTYANTSVLPINNIVMEHRAAKQIVETIGDSETYCLVTPGVGAPTPTYVSRSILRNGYLLARGTFGATDSSVNSKLANYIFHADDLLTESRLRSVPAFMIEHFNSSPDVITTSSSTNEECLAAGIKNWTDFMDLALANGGWASFCLHEIRPDTYTGGDHHIYESQAKELFAYANAYGERAWIARYDDAARYFLAWAYATPNATVIDDKLIVLSLDTTTGDERLAVPLTVKVKLQNSWLGVTLDGEELEIREEENGTRYVLVDLVPGNSVTLEITGYTAEDDLSVMA